MKHLIQVFAIVFIMVTLSTFESCLKQEDDLISQNCKGSCATITGILTTNDGKQPLTGVTIVANWLNTHYLSGGTIRKKAITQTDNSGNYTLHFEVRDDELKLGYFRFDILAGKQYFKCDKYEENISFSIFDLKNDTTIYRDLFIPYVAYLNVNATGVQNMLTSEGFLVTVRPTVKTNSKGCEQVLQWTNQDPNQSFKVNIPANQDLVIETEIIRGQRHIRKYDTLFVNKGQTANFTAVYK